MGGGGGGWDGLVSTLVDVSGTRSGIFELGIIILLLSIFSNTLLSLINLFIDSFCWGIDRMFSFNPAISRNCRSLGSILCVLSTISRPRAEACIPLTMSCQESGCRTYSISLSPQPSALTPSPN